MAHHRSNNTSQHPHHAYHPALSHAKWVLNGDVSQDHDTDNWSCHVYLDVSVDYITVFNVECYQTSPVVLRLGDEVLW